MAEVASAFVSLLPSAKGFGSKLDSQIGPEVKRSGEGAGKRFGGGLLESVKGFAAPLAAFFAVDAAKDFFSDAIAGASDLNEAGTKLQAIFGPATDAVQDFASKGAKALGQTRLEVLNSAATFGVFGKAAGLTGPALSGFSTQLAQLSTDLASFYNTDPSQAAEAIAAGLRGESEPLRQYGVLLDDATLRQEALRQGLIKTTKDALTPQQKVLAAQAVIMRQTKDAQGDFARTSGGLANQQRILTAQFEDFKSMLGTALLPIAVKVVTFLNDAMGPAIDTVIGYIGDFGKIIGPVFSQVSDSIQLFFGTLTGQGADVDLPWMNQIIDAAGTLSTVFGSISDSVRLFIGTLTGQGADVDVAWMNAIINAAGFVSEAVDQIGAAFQNVFAAYSNYVATLVPIISQFVSAFLAKIQPLMPQVMEIFGTVKDIVVSALNLVAQVISSVTQAIAFIWKNWGDQITSVAAFAFKAVVGVVGPALTVIKNLIQFFTNVLQGNWSGAFANIRAITDAQIAAVKSIISTAMTVIKALFSFGLSALGSVTSAAFNGVRSAVESGIGAAVSLVQSLPGRILSALGNLGSLLYNAGRSVISGLIDGIQSQISNLGNVLGGVGDFIVQHKGPPSKDAVLLRNNGRLIMDGLITGISDREAALGAKLASLTTSLPVQVGSPSASGSGLRGGGVNVTFSGDFISTGTPEMVGEELDKRIVKALSLVSMVGVP